MLTARKARFIEVEEEPESKINLESLSLNYPPPLSPLISRQLPGIISAPKMDRSLSGTPAPKTNPSLSGMLVEGRTSAEGGTSAEGDHIFPDHRQYEEVRPAFQLSSFPITESFSEIRSLPEEVKDDSQEDDTDKINTGDTLCVSRTSSKKMRNKNKQIKIRTATIKKDLAGKGLSENVCTAADGIYKKMGFPVRRGKPRRRLLFACVYYASKEIDHVFGDPYKLGEKFGLDKGGVNTAINEYASYVNISENISRPSRPSDYVNAYCGNLGIDGKIIENICDLAKQIEQQDISILNEKPQKVAAGIISYYFFITSKSVDDASIKGVTGQTISVINKYRLKVSDIHNNTV